MHKLHINTICMQKTPNPFPIPMFRVDTQKNLKDKKLGDDDRKYIIRVLATMLCTYVQRPSMRDCEIVAKSLVARFSFLKEHVSYILRIKSLEKTNVIYLYIPVLHIQN